MRSLTAIAAATALLLAACSGADNPDGGGDTSTQVTRAPAGDVTPATVDLDGQVTLAAALQPFGSCDDFLGHVQREASERVQPHGLPGTANYSPGGVILEDSAEAAATDSDSAPAPTTTGPDRRRDRVPCRPGRRTAPVQARTSPARTSRSTASTSPTS